ncbi:acyl-CoA thioesterase [Arenibaculum pallidiluteum]|uniref:acyl-CoA thioesterase n=1 Tax=Arenibaculum pallidiluteum TaxID=2812559 RepID=UPI001A9683A6|nr:thioesterase family protein [Arenibaculum pallidiluteum]
MSDLRDARTYRYWIDEHVRFADLDPLGHANNNAIGAYFEASRVALFGAAGKPLGGGSGGGSAAGTSPGTSVVLARIAIDFLAELRYGAALRVGTRVLAMGRTSVTLGAAVFADGRCAAASEGVCVLFDLATRRPTVLPDELRARLTEVAG